jgi:hypothetical protein
MKPGGCESRGREDASARRGWAFRSEYRLVAAEREPVAHPFFFLLLDCFDTAA